MNESDQHKKFGHPSLSSDQCTQLEAFAKFIQQENKIHNLTAITETEQIYTRHFGDSLAALPVIEAGWINKPSPSLIDIGSGAGLPAMVLAIALPKWNITSVEATGKKVNFQRKAIDELGLKNATVIHGRAEELAHEKAYRERFDVVTARAVSALNILFELCLPFIRLGGRFIAWKGPDITAELEQANEALKVLGGQVEQIIPYSVCAPGIENPFKLIVTEKIADTGKSYPRQYNQIKRSPL